MVFSSTVFLFFFLPITILLYYLAPGVRVKNAVLLSASLFFYFWGGREHILILLFSIAVNYIGGCLLGYFDSINKEKLRKTTLIAVVALNILNLGYWKYTGFLLRTCNSVFRTGITIPSIVLPIGISFFTFQGLSYVIDVYRKKTDVQRNPFRLGLYISLFPQLIAGPIVRYSDINQRLGKRAHSTDAFALGMQRFTLGLAKKSILANAMAINADKIFAMDYARNTPAIAWLGIASYVLQLYFDFSGYSDMAIGLGKIFGFDFLENFNYPYISSSFREIWRRWHMSLSGWFRDYVYIPLGGSRQGNVYVNLMVVFFLTGLWHGASWNFVIWGVLAGVFVLSERYWEKHFAFRLPKIIGWIKTMAEWMICFVFFRAETATGAVQYIGSMFGLIARKNPGYSLAYYLQMYNFVMLLICVAAMGPWWKKLQQTMQAKMNETLYAIVSNGFCFVLFLISVMYIITDAYNPFLYFQF